MLSYSIHPQTVTSSFYCWWSLVSSSCWEALNEVYKGRDIFSSVLINLHLISSSFKHFETRISSPKTQIGLTTLFQYNVFLNSNSYSHCGRHDHSPFSRLRPMPCYPHLPTLKTSYERCLDHGVLE